MQDIVRGDTTHPPDPELCIGVLTKYVASGSHFRPCIPHLLLVCQPGSRHLGRPALRIHRGRITEWPLHTGEALTVWPWLCVIQPVPDLLHRCQTLNSGLFIVNLDTEDPRTPADVADTFLFGGRKSWPPTDASKSCWGTTVDGMARWYDKSVQLVVTASGRAAFNFEHSWGDGSSLTRAYHEIVHDMLGTHAGPWPSVPHSSPLTAWPMSQARRVDSQTRSPAYPFPHAHALPPITCHLCCRTTGLRRLTVVPRLACRVTASQSSVVRLYAWPAACQTWTWKRTGGLTSGRSTSKTTGTSVPML